MAGWEALTFVDIVQRAPDKVSDTGLLGRINQGLALLVLELVVHLLPVVGNGKDSGRAGHGLDQGRLVIEIGLHGKLRER